MINFQIGAARDILGEIHLLVTLSANNARVIGHFAGGHKNPVIRADADHQQTITETKDGVKKTVKLVRDGFGYLECPHIKNTCNSLERWADAEYPNWEDLRMKAIHLRDAIETELNQYYYYQYPKQKALVLKSWKDDWKSALAAFPGIQADILRATDCYALGHDVASVFYCMRILESGLGAIAADVGLTFDLQQWHNIIDQIESKITTERKTLPKGADRNERLQFLSETAKEFFYFKDGWRNYVSHNRADYDEHQALSVLSHVRAFMNHLSSRLAEVP